MAQAAGGLATVLGKVGVVIMVSFKVLRVNSYMLSVEYQKRANKGFGSMMGLLLMIL